VDVYYEGMDDALLVKSLREGEEGAFAWLVQKYHNSLVRLALSYVQDRGLAEEVAQETWIAVLKGLDRFEIRSSLKTWIFTILTNRAKTRSQRERRSLPFSELDDPFGDESTVAPERFRSMNSQTLPGHWIVHPSSWDDVLPESAILSQELQDVVLTAISDLPLGQRAVITLCDIEGFSADEVCNILGTSETNQRVLLHRARAKVRNILENYLNLED
jgi:RNA polymerase sigma-70 factor (ECF subfamily)